jgi:TM2 domain-containing membrane protein YozV
MSDTIQKADDEAFCKSCGAIIKKEAEICPKCGVRQFQPGFDSNASPKSRLIAFLLCTFLGVIGVHRFYTGKITSGIFMILTLGGIGVWALVDWIMILAGSFSDKEGMLVKNWHAD